MQAKKEVQYYAKRISPEEYEIQLNRKYTITSDSKNFEQMPLVINLINQKNKREKEKYHDVFQISYFPTLEFLLGKCNMEEEKCMICLEEFIIKDVTKELDADYDDDILMLGCSHKYHKVCLLQMIGERKWAKCAICSTIFGHMTGDQPPGSMTHYVDQRVKCSGYLDVGTIIIIYDIYDGKRNGKKFSGTTRYAYLPDNPDGREVFGLLKEAFDRKLIFTIGRSVTTGKDHQVVWNGIHHKTNNVGGSASFGYPDPTYFTRVKEQLAAKGIVPKKRTA